MILPALKNVNQGQQESKTWVIDYEGDKMVLYGVRKNGKYLYQYQNQKAHWVYALDRAWMTSNKQMAISFAEITKGTTIEITLTEKAIGL